jgi:hypothetical protein
MSQVPQIVLIIGAWVVMIAVVRTWGWAREKTLRSNSTAGRVTHYALGPGALALLLVLAVIGGRRSHDFVHPLLDVFYILLPLCLIHWVITKIQKRTTPVQNPRA